MVDDEPEIKPDAELEEVPEKKPDKAVAADNSDGDDADFEEDFDDDDDDDDSSDDDDELDASTKPRGEVEAEDLEEGGGAGPSSGVKKRKADEDTFGRIEQGLSGDEVDAGNIIEGGRRSRRGRGGESKPKYTAQAAVASDEDSW